MHAHRSDGKTMWNRSSRGCKKPENPILNSDFCIHNSKSHLEFHFTSELCWWLCSYFCQLSQFLRYAATHNRRTRIRHLTAGVELSNIILNHNEWAIKCHRKPNGLMIRFVIVVRPSISISFGWCPSFVRIYAMRPATYSKFFFQYRIEIRWMRELAKTANGVNLCSNI